MTKEQLNAIEAQEVCTPENYRDLIRARFEYLKPAYEFCRKFNGRVMPKYNPDSENGWDFCRWHIASDKFVREEDGMTLDVDIEMQLEDMIIETYINGDLVEQFNLNDPKLYGYSDMDGIDKLKQALEASDMSFFFDDATNWWDNRYAQDDWEDWGCPSIANQA